MTKEEAKKMGATHYLNDEYYVKDIISLWCYFDAGFFYLYPNAEHEYNDLNLKPL